MMIQPPPTVERPAEQRPELDPITAAYLANRGADFYPVRTPGTWCYASWHTHRADLSTEDCAYLAGPETPGWATTSAAMHALKELGLTWSGDWCQAEVETARALMGELEKRISAAEYRIARR